MIYSNVLLTATVANFALYVLPNGAVIPLALVYDDCSCKTSAKCIMPSSIFIDQSRTVLFTVPGMYVGCYPVESLLQSDLRCFYNQTCINTLQLYLNASSPMNVTALDSSILAAFMVNSRVEDIVNNLMVEKWIQSMMYENYYNECSTTQCIYIHKTKNILIYIITTTVGLTGGLVTALKLIVPRFVAFIGFCIRKYKMKYNHNQVLPIVES